MGKYAMKRTLAAALMLIYSGVAWGQTNSSLVVGATDPTMSPIYPVGTFFINSTTGTLWYLSPNGWSVLGMLSTLAPAPNLITPAYYVSTTGSDSNPGTFASPFLTLNKARLAMQSGPHVAYAMGGTYTLTATLAFVGADNNATLLAYPGQTPIIDGGASLATCVSMASGVSGIKINGFTIQRCTSTGIDIVSNNYTLTNNKILNITSASTGAGSIYVHFLSSGGIISHNLISSNTGPGIVFATGSGTESINNSTVDNNIVLNTNTTLADSGGIYIFDLGQSITQFKVTNNIVGNYGANTTSSNKAIYLDDLTSHVMVSGNIVYGTGQYAIQIHGGNNNTFQDNIFDLTAAGKLGLYQDSTHACPGMTGNIFINNIVYSSSATVPTTLWDYLVTHCGTIALPAVNNNLYFDPAATLPNSGTIVDSAPLVADPLFANAANHLYNLSSTSPALAAPVSFVPGSGVQGPH
jgi:hypothetical protein